MYKLHILLFTNYLSNLEDVDAAEIHKSGNDSYHHDGENYVQPHE